MRLAIHISSIFSRSPIPVYEREIAFPCCQAHDSADQENQDDLTREPQHMMPYGPWPYYSHRPYGFGPYYGSWVGSAYGRLGSHRRGRFGRRGGYRGRGKRQASAGEDLEQKGDDDLREGHGFNPKLHKPKKKPHLHTKKKSHNLKRREVTYQTETQEIQDDLTRSPQPQHINDIMCYGPCRYYSLRPYGVGLWLLDLILRPAAWFSQNRQI